MCGKGVEESTRCKGACSEVSHTLEFSLNGCVAAPEEDHLWAASGWVLTCQLKEQNGEWSGTNQCQNENTDDQVNNIAVTQLLGSS